MRVTVWTLTLESDYSSAETRAFTTRGAALVSLLGEFDGYVAGEDEAVTRARLVGIIQDAESAIGDYRTTGDLAELAERAYGLLAEGNCATITSHDLTY